MFAECLSIPGTEDIWIEKKKFLPSRSSQSKDTKGKKKKIQTHVVSFVFLNCVLTMERLLCKQLHIFTMFLWRWEGF